LEVVDLLSVRLENLTILVRANGRQIPRTLYLELSDTLGHEIS